VATIVAGGPDVAGERGGKNGVLVKELSHVEAGEPIVIELTPTPSISLTCGRLC